MPYEIPSIETLVQKYEQAYVARVPAEKQMPISKMKAKARALAQAVGGLYGYGGFILRQIIPLTAEAEFLDLHASAADVFRKSAAQAFGKIAVTGASGAIVPQNTVLTFNDGTAYVVSADTMLGTEATNVPVTAVDAGTSGNRTAGDILAFSVPVAGVQNQASVVSIGGGTDTETDEDLLYRYLLKVRTPAHGGCDADYVNWALSVPGVTRCTVYPHEQGIGTVVLRIMSDGIGNGQASEEVIERCAEYIESVRPVTAKRIFILSPAPTPVDFTISDLKPDLPSVRDEIKAELSDLFFREATPGGTVLISHIRSAISAAYGEEDHVLVTPVENVTAKANEILTLGEITWS